MRQTTRINPTSDKPRIALALGGGAARGWAHIGVLRALDEFGIKPDLIVGTSIGAVVGGCYVAAQLDALEEFARAMNLSRILGCLDFTFSRSGLMSGRKIRHELKKHLNDIQIEELACPFTAVATELGTGREVCLSHGSLVEAMHASFAIPGVFQPVEIGGRWFMDGACVNPVPVSVCQAGGADVVIAVSVNSSRYQGQGGISAGSDAADMRGAGEALPVMPSANPTMFNVMMEAFNATLETITKTRLAHEKPDIVIAPEVGEIGMFDFHRAEEAIAAGYKAARAGLASLVVTPKPRPYSDIAA